MQIFINFLQFVFGERRARRRDDEQVAIIRHAGAASELQTGERERVLRERLAEFQKTMFATVVGRNLAVAGDKIRLERLRIFQREQHRGENFFAVKAHGADVQLLVRGHPDRAVFQKLACGKGPPVRAAAVENDEVLVRRGVEAVFDFGFLRLARVADVIHEPHGDFFVCRFVFLQQRGHVGIKIRPPVEVKRDVHLVGERMDHGQRARRKLHARLRTQIVPRRKFRAEIIHHHHHREREQRPQRTVENVFPALGAGKTRLRFLVVAHFISTGGFPPRAKSGTKRKNSRSNKTRSRGCPPRRARNRPFGRTN